MGKGTGNDGGVVAVKRYLIKEKKEDRSGAERAKRNVMLKFRTCALSSAGLVPPIAADELGNLYNKEAVLQYLINKREMPAFSHIKSLKKDIVTLNVTRNSAVKADSREDVDIEEGPSPFICPISFVEANGLVPFVAVRPCGCMLSLEALQRTLPEAGDSGSVLCPVCNAVVMPHIADAPEFTNVKGVQVIRLAPSEEETEVLRTYLTAKKAKAAEAGSGSKRPREAAPISNDMPSKVSRSDEATSIRHTKTDGAPKPGVQVSLAPAAAAEAVKKVSESLSQNPVFASLFQPSRIT